MLFCFDFLLICVAVALNTYKMEGGGLKVRPEGHKFISNSSSLSCVTLVK